MLTSHMLNRAPPPDPRERDWQELMAAWAERAYTGLGEQWNRKYGRRLDLGPPE